MLRSLEIRDLLIIDHLALEFQPGLNVLTGETGAGKSILLDALGLALGWRGRGDLVRAGAERGEVTAVFETGTGHPAEAVLAESGFPPAGELILRRVVGADGRKTGWINDRRAGAELLRALSDRLVELHGQRDAGLLDPRAHRTLLDAFACAGKQVEEVRSAWQALAKARRRLAEAETALERGREEEAFLRHAVTELDRLDPQPGEEAELDTRRRLAQAAARIRDDVARAAEALGEDGAEGRMVDALRWLTGVADRAEGRLDAALDALGRAQAELGEAQRGVLDTLEALGSDPAELDRVEERLFALRGLARKHGVLPEALPALAGELRERLAGLDRGAAGLTELSGAATAAEARYDAAAGALTALRREAAERLDAGVAGELAPLKLERARFETVLEEAPAGPEGRDAVAFHVAANPGAPAGPLDRVASGGELSRILLALKVCLTADIPGMTLVFDEIDRGVGGATADAVGRRLSALARQAQVVVVTHSPQVAALADHHWRVEKRVSGEVTTSLVTPLGAGERVDEIARMLAGEAVTDEARGAARALLAG